MPPLPSTIQEETTSLVDILTRRQKDLNDFQIPRLRDFRGSLATQQQYAAELREDLELFSRNVKALNALADDQERERDRREAAHRAQQFEESLEQMRKDTRAALLTSKRAIDSLAQSNRDELLRSTVLSEKKPSDEKSGDALMNASNDVTEALRRTLGLMQGELERSVLSSQMLEQSSANLRSTTTVYDTLSTLLSTSKHLITALEKSDWLDRLLILAALAFFFLVVLFILKQRVVDKGLRFAFWWTRFIPDFSGDAALLKAERGEAGTLLTTAAATALSTALSTVSTLAATATASQVASSSDPLDAYDEALSTLVPSDSTPATPGADAVEEAIQELLHSTPSRSDPPHPTSTVLHNEHSQHEEL